MRFFIFLFCVFFPLKLVSQETQEIYAPRKRPPPVHDYSKDVTRDPNIAPVTRPQIFSILNPDFNKAVTPVPKGTKLQLICANREQKILCVDEWSKQAVPLAVYSDKLSQDSEYKYFLPTIRPSSGINYKSPVGDKNWRPYVPISSSPAPSSVPQYYINTSNNSDIRIVETDSTGKQTVRGGEVLFLPEDELTLITVDTKTGDTSVVIKSGKGELTQESLDGVAVATNADSIGLLATQKLSTGCIKTDVTTKTEAEFCFECQKEEPVLSEVNDGVIPAIKGFLKIAEEMTQNKVAEQLEGGEMPAQICFSDTPLKKILQNFKNKCTKKYGVQFKDFFKKTYCDSCKKGVPPEVMLAMMSIESAGRCEATLKNKRENSLGLFQVNSINYSCNGNRAGTKANRNCLKKPYNSLKYSLEILTQKYGQVNPQKLPGDECQSWSQMDDTEKDSWRRAVAAYNSRGGWVTRAIRSARETKVLTSTQYLSDEKAHKDDDSPYREDEAPWESIRAYLFLEKLLQNPNIKAPEQGAKVSLTKRLPGDEKKMKLTGRQVQLTLSNLAHTEAVLGRNNSSGLSMVDMWTRYSQYSELKEGYPLSCQFLPTN